MTGNTIRTFVLCAAALIGLSGCGPARVYGGQHAAATKVAAPATPDAAPEYGDIAARSAHAPESGSAGSFFRDTNNPIASIAAGEGIEHAFDLQIQRSGWIKLDVKKEIQFSATLRGMAKGFDAMVMAFSDRSVTYKMPAANLDRLIDALTAMKDVDVDAYDFSAYDRTAEYYGLEPRLESTNALRARLMEMMKSTTSLSDLFRIEEKIEEAQIKIDRLMASKRDIEMRAGLVDVVIRLQ